MLASRRPLGHRDMHDKRYRNEDNVNYVPFSSVISASRKSSGIRNTGHLDNLLQARRTPLLHHMHLA